MAKKDRKLHTHTHTHACLSPLSLRARCHASTDSISREPYPYFLCRPPTLPRCLFPSRVVSAWAKSLQTECSHSAPCWAERTLTTLTTTQTKLQFKNCNFKPPHLSFPLSCPFFSILHSHGWHCTVTGPLSGALLSALQASSLVLLLSQIPPAIVSSLWVTDCVSFSSSLIQCKRVCAIWNLESIK